MNDGWIKIHRKALKSSVFQDSKTWTIWCWVLTKATHEKRKVPFNGKDVELQPGQFIMGYDSALKELTPDISRQNLRTKIRYLISTGRITHQSNNKFSLVTVINWGQYQDANRQTNIPLTGHQQATNIPLTANKNVRIKELKKVEREEKKKFSHSQNFSFSRLGFQICTSYKRVLELTKGVLLPDEYANKEWVRIENEYGPKDVIGIVEDEKVFATSRARAILQTNINIKKAEVNNKIFNFDK